MAREQRKDVDYFPHECVHGRKMHIIESKYGNDGYATWFKLLEQLGKANNHFIHIDDESVLMYLASVFRVQEEMLINILKDLAKLGAIDKVLYENYNVIWSQKFVDSVSDAYRKRKTETPQYSAVLDVIKAKIEPIRAGNPPIRAGIPEVIRKEEYSIEEYSKEEEIIEENTPNGVVGLENQPDQPKIYFKKLISFFNANRGALPEVKKLSEPRKKRILILEKKYGKESIQLVIQKTRESDFLQGNNKNNWTASFDWIFKPENFIKILEDNYANKQPTRAFGSERTDLEHKQSAVSAVARMFNSQQ